MTALCDTNVWLAIAIAGHRHHSAAAEWLDSVDTRDSALFCRVTQLSLLRLLTTPAVLAPYGAEPLTNQAAWEVYHDLEADDRIRLLPAEPAGISTHWQQYSHRATASPKLWMDAYLAGFARAGQHRLVTFDGGFLHYAGLDVTVLT